MKTLVLQLARLGDIYQTWPVLRALKRGGAEVHLLVRDKFKVAAEGNEAIASIWTMDSREILGPLINDKPDIDAAMERIDSLLVRLSTQEFQRVINLSYSPFSSRLTHLLSAPGVDVRGYSRHLDGWLDVVDDASAYFFAQVGPDRQNRVHLTDIFAETAGVILEETDWSRAPQWREPHVVAEEVAAVLSSPVRPILVHIGASQSEKTYGAYKWLHVIKGLLEATDTPVVLLGSTEERAIAQTAGAVSSARRPVDLVGKTSLRDVFELARWARLLIGGDSAPVHIAALTGTPVLNLSFSSVSFWETGPKSAGSRILAFASPQDLASDLVVREALTMLDGNNGDERVIHVRGRLQPYDPPPEKSSSAEWEWLQAIYMGRPFPVPESEACHQGLKRLYQANQLALDQLRRLQSRPGDSIAIGILERFDEIIGVVGRLVPTLNILLRWFQTERVRIGPLPPDEILQRTLALHEKLHEILSLYQRLWKHAANDPAEPAKGNESHDNIRVE